MLDITREHPFYIRRKHMWTQYRDLYTGGEQLRLHATEYLVRRQKEPADVYNERLCRVFYENYIGSIIDWYASTLFRREPVLTFDNATSSAGMFYSDFTDDCDLKGSTLTDLLRRQFVETLVSGSSLILVDFPRSVGKVENRAQEDQLGASRAYLVEYAPEDVINWSRDEHGRYEWLVIRTEALRKERASDADWVTETRWSYYDKERFQIYRRIQRPNETGEVELIDEGFHGLAALKRVPVFEMAVPEGLWLLNKAGLLQLEHFNKSNALAWALTMGLFAMPVVYSDREWNQIVGESYYIQLAPEDRFGWTEPEGKVYQIAAENLQRLQQEIYRVCHLAQAGGDLSGGSAQSGLSKQRDFSVTHEVLRAYGDAVKAHLRRVLWAINAAREDNVTIAVTGLDEFDIGDFSNELADAQGLLKMGIASPTLKKQVFKKVALQYLCDARQELKDQICREIDLEV